MLRSGSCDGLSECPLPGTLTSPNILSQVSNAVDMGCYWDGEFFLSGQPGFLLESSLRNIKEQPLAEVGWGSLLESSMASGPIQKARGSEERLSSAFQDRSGPTHVQDGEND